jgi:hypothetical protein
MSIEQSFFYGMFFHQVVLSEKINSTLGQSKAAVECGFTPLEK